MTSGEIQVMNLWLFFGITCLATIAIIGWGFVKQNQAIAGILAAVTIIFTRAIQMLNPYREFGDSYFYWSVTEAILRNDGLIALQTLKWYPGIQELLSFPGMHLTTATLIKITGIQDPAVARAIIPSLYGVVCFALLVGIAARVIGSEWSVIVAYTTIQIDVFIFYQTEYHAQSFGLLFIVFILFVFVRQLVTIDSYRNTIVFGFAVMGLTLAHRFSSLLALLLFGGAIAGLAIYAYLPTVRHSLTRRRDVTIYGLAIGISLIFLHSLVYSSVIEKAVFNFFLVTKGSGAGFASSPASYAAETPTIVDEFSKVIKVFLTVVAAPTIVYSLFKEHDHGILFILAFLGATGLAAIPVAIVNFEVITRVIMIAFVPLTLVSFYTLRERLPTSTSKPAAAVLAMMIVVMGVAGGVSSSHIDPSSNIRADGFQYVTPMSGHHEVGGYWIRAYATADDTGVTVKTRHTAVYFGHQSVKNTEYISMVRGGKRYIVVDEARRNLSSPERIYSNGRIVIGYNESVMPSRELAR